MSKKPTYEELEQRVEELEIKLVKRRSFEQAFRDSQERLELAVDGANLAMWNWYVDTGRVEYSPRWSEILGYSPEEIEPHVSAWEKLVHPEDMPLVMQKINANLEGLTSFYECEHRLKTKSGEWRWVLARGKVVERDNDGKPLRHTGTQFDISDRVMAQESIKKANEELEYKVVERTSELLNANELLKKEIKERKQAEAALRENEERYRLIAENVADVIWTMDMNFNFTYISPSIYQLRGYTVEEAMRQSIEEVILPDSLERVINLFTGKLSLTESGDEEGFIPVYFEVSQPCKDGSVIHTGNNARILPGTDKKAASMLGVTRDITQRKQAEEALRASEQKYHQLFLHAPAGIYEVDFTNGRFIRINSVICDYTGYSREELLTMSPLDILTKESQNSFLERLEKLNKGENVSANPEYCMKNKDGSTRWVQLNSQFTYKEGVAIGATVVAHDISERKQAEEEVKKSEEKYRSILENMEEGYWETDLAGNFTFFNDSLCKILGYSRNEMLGMNYRKYTNPKVAARVYRLFNQVYQTGQPIRTIEYETIAKDGSIVNIEGSVLLLRDNLGQPLGFCGVNRDLTQRKQAEETLRKSEEKLARSRKMESLGLLAGGVAHDLNNVLSGIVSYPELILMDLPEDSKLRESIETIKESGHRAVAIVQDLLTVARGVAISKNPLNLSGLVGDYIHSPEFSKLQQFFPSVTVKTNFDVDLFNISGSHVHIRKAVMNLVSNAAEAIQGSGMVTISTMNRYMDRPLRGYDDVKIGEYVVLSVSDDGLGISSDDLERVFEPFYTKKVMGRSGTGLGLAVVWNIMLDHKGYIDVISDENGTTFELYFPTTREEVSGEDLSIPINDYKGKGETILVIDDVESQRDISCRMLEKLGYQTKSVASGEEAVEYLKVNSADLILLDMIMDPGINGRETYARIIEIHPEQKAIIVSGFAETDNVKATQKLGAGIYIKKPFTMEKIGLAVKEELGK